MKMFAELPLDGKNFKYVISNDGVSITGKLRITSELASLSMCDLKLDISRDGYITSEIASLSICDSKLVVSLDGCYKVVILKVGGKYYLSTEVHYLWGEFKGFRDSFKDILELLKDVRRNLVDKYDDILAANYLNRLKNPKSTRDFGEKLSADNFVSLYEEVELPW